MDIKKTQEILDIIKQITYKPNWKISMFGYFGTGYYMQLEVENSIDTVTGKVVSWKSGKRYLSEHMCRQEIVGLAYGLIESAEIHEMREWFRYKGASIYNPHLDPDSLVEVAKKAANFNCRKSSMTMKED